MNPTLKKIIKAEIAYSEAHFATWKEFWSPDLKWIVPGVTGFFLVGSLLVRLISFLFFSATKLFDLSVIIYGFLPTMLLSVVLLLYAISKVFYYEFILRLLRLLPVVVSDYMNRFFKATILSFVLLFTLFQNNGVLGLSFGEKMATSIRLTPHALIAQLAILLFGFKIQLWDSKKKRWIRNNHAFYKGLMEKFYFRFISVDLWLTSTDVAREYLDLLEIHHLQDHNYLMMKDVPDLPYPEEVVRAALKVCYGRSVLFLESRGEKEVLEAGYNALFFVKNKANHWYNSCERDKYKEELRAFRWSLRYYKGDTNSRLNSDSYLHYYAFICLKHPEIVQTLYKANWPEHSSTTLFNSFVLACLSSLVKG